MQLTRLTVEHAAEPLALPTLRPRFSWRLDAGDARHVRQERYELQLHTGGTLVAEASGGGESVLVDVLDADLCERTRYEWRVRAWVAVDAEPTPWASAWFETARVDLDGWSARWVDPAQQPVTRDGSPNPFAPNVNDDPNEVKLHPAKHLRQQFTLASAPASARLRMTAQGIYFAELNGVRVGDECFAPGYEGYHKLLSVQTYDVTDSLRAGDNVLGVVLADGWFAGRIAFTGTSRQYGERLRATWELEVTGADGATTIIRPDAGVRSTTEGPFRCADIFIGESYDARRELPGWSAPGFDASGWDAVTLAPVTEHLVAFLGEPVRRVLELPAVDVLTTPAGETVVDFGQVTAGRVRFTVRGPAGTKVTLEHAEVLDAEGNYLNNIAGHNKDQTDHYVLRGEAGGETWEPEFTFHGFRYARLTGWPTAPAASDFTAIVIASDLAYEGSWASSDPRLNQLHHNVVWSQRGNLLAVPTDCPQRERAGWTGDIQIFAPAATNNADVSLFLARWLRNVRAEQGEDGLIPIIVPMPRAFDEPDAPPDASDDGGEIFAIQAAAGWGDAIVIVPHVLWRRTGDVAFLARNYDAMVAWSDLQRRQAAEHLPPRLAGVQLSERQRANHALLWNGEPNFGDWLTPSLSDAADPASIMEAPRRTAEYVGPFFAGQSLTLLAEIADALGRDAEASDFAARAAEVRRAWAEEYLDADGRIRETLMGVFVLALAFGFVPEAHRDAVRRQLVEAVHANGDRLDTGFLSGPYLLPALWDAGERDLARTLLWQSECPSWLYEVDRGATTIWESWDAVKPDGTVGMSSFNHYAFGIVDDWLFGVLAGIREASPGYRRAVIAPDLDAPLEWVDAAVDTPYGPLRSAWRRDGGAVGLTVEVPPSTEAEVRLPSGWAIVLEGPDAGSPDAEGGDAEGADAGAGVRLGSGRWDLRAVRG